MSGQRRWLGIRMTRRQREVLLPFGGALLAGVLLGLLLASWLVFDSNAYRLFRDAMVLLGSGLLTWFGWRRVKAADQQNRNQTRALDRQTDQIRLTREQMELTRRDQLSKRFTEAVKQLGDGKLEIRMGGIAGLWAVATESTHPEDRIMVLDVLCAFVRNSPHPKEDEPQTVRPDVKFAMDRLGSEGPYFPWGDVEEGHRPYRRDFSGAYLVGYDFIKLNLSYSIFKEIIIHKLFVSNCIFSSVYFEFKNINYISIVYSDLSGSNFFNIFREMIDGVIIDNKIPEISILNSNLSGLRFYGFLEGNVKSRVNACFYHEGEPPSGIPEGVIYSMSVIPAPTP